MKLTSERRLVRTVAARWKRAYYKNKEWFSSGRPDDNRAAIYEQLRQLDVKTATAADVEAIVGNESWVRPEECTVCGEPSWDVVHVHESAGSDDRDFHMCPCCLRDALKIAGSAP